MTTRIYDCEVAPTEDQCSKHEHLSQFGPDFIYADLTAATVRTAVSVSGSNKERLSDH